MTPTITLGLSEYLMLKEDVKKLDKAIADKSVIVKTITRSCGGEYTEETYQILSEADAFSQLRDRYEKEADELRWQIKDARDTRNEQLRQMSEYKAKWQTVKEKLDIQLNTPWWKKIF
jgi:uncharacterized coiled-coil DUF342 family protein